MRSVFQITSICTRTTVAPLAPIEHKRSASGHSPMVEQVSIIAVK